MIDQLRRIRREFLGLNARNHRYLLSGRGALDQGLVDDKLATHRHLAGRGVPMPRLLATHERRGPIGPLLAVLEKHPRFVVKPARGARGDGVLLVTGRDRHGFTTAAGAGLTPAQLSLHLADVLNGAFSRGRLPDVAMIEALVDVDTAMVDWAFGGLPDCRIVLMRGVPLLAMLRLGTMASRGRGNLHAGAIAVGVDLASGRTLHAVHRRRTVINHPDTGIALVGQVVPYWSRLVMMAARAAATVPLALLGVDLLVDRDRGPVVLELNARPGLGIQEANLMGLAPLLAQVSAGRRPTSVRARVAWGQRIYCSLASAYS